MSWPHRIHMAIPADLLPLAQSISLAMDPDSGGDGTFSVPLSSSGEAPATHYGASSAAAQDFAQNVLDIISGIIPLSLLVESAYAERWPDKTPPTIEECEQFRSALLVEVDTLWKDFTDRNNLKKIES